MEISLTDENYVFIKDVLNESGLLGIEILKRFDSCIHKGNLLINESIPLCHSFEYGGVSSKEDSYKTLFHYINSTLANNPSSFFILHNQCARREDPVVSNYLYPVFLHDEVYHILHQENNLNIIRQTVLEAETGMSLVGAYIADGQRLLPERRGKITPELMKKYVANCNALFVGICDGDAYCVFVLNG